MIDLPSPKDFLQMIVAARIAKCTVALDDLSAVANVPRDELAQATRSLAVAILAFNDLAMLCAAGLERLERAKVRLVK